MMSRKYDVISLLQKYTTCYKDYPVHTFSKVILCGDTGAGKSSLAKVKYQACWDITSLIIICTIVDRQKRPVEGVCCIATLQI